MNYPYIITSSRENYEFIISQLQKMGYDISQISPSSVYKGDAIVVDYCHRFGVVANVSADHVYCSNPCYGRVLYSSTNEFLKKCAELKNYTYDSNEITSLHDLKPGMIIKIACGKTYLVMEVDSKIFATNYMGWLDLSTNNYNEDMTNKYVPSYDIQEVYIMEKYGGMLGDILFIPSNKNQYGTPKKRIWKRPNQKIKISKKEIAEKFNIDADCLDVID